MIKCIGCKNKTDLLIAKYGIFITKGNKGTFLDYNHIAMIYIGRRRKMTIITTLHRMYPLRFYNSSQLNTAIDALQEQGVFVWRFK